MTQLHVNSCCTVSSNVYTSALPWGLRRYHHSGHSHFITFTCFHPLPLLNPAGAKRTFEAALERVRKNYRLRVYAYVVMPKDVHLLVSEPELETLAIKSLKQGVSRRLIGNADHFWQKRYYDFNVLDNPKLLNKCLEKYPLPPDDLNWQPTGGYLGVLPWNDMPFDFELAPLKTDAKIIFAASCCSSPEFERWWGIFDSDPTTAVGRRQGKH